MDKQLAKKMINPYIFTDKALQVGFNVRLNSHHIDHLVFSISKKSSKPIFPELGIESKYINKKIQKLATIYIKLIF